MEAKAITVECIGAEARNIFLFDRIHFMKAILKALLQCKQEEVQV